MADKRYIVTHADANIDVEHAAMLLKRDKGNVHAIVDASSMKAQEACHFCGIGVTILPMTDHEAGQLKELPDVSVIEDFKIEGFGDLSVDKSKTQPTTLATDKKFATTDSGQKIPENIQTVGADLVWPYATGKGVKVAVLDTGIYKGHPDLEVAGGVLIEQGVVVNHTGWGDNSIKTKSHGTQCAGIIGARNNEQGIVGIAPECDLYSVKILDSNIEGDFSSLLRALHWALHESMDVLSISCRWTDQELANEGHEDCYRDALKRLVDHLNQKGCVIVAASGNMDDGHPENMVSEPAREEGVIAVGAIDRGWFSNSRIQYGYHWQQDLPLAPFSCWKPGGIVDICAPGVDIDTTVNPNIWGNMYQSGIGTSMACPHVAGAAGLLKELYRDWTSEQIRSALCHHAWDIGKKGKDDETGYGLLDCFASAEIKS